MSDSYKFDDQIKEVREFKERLPFGITEVTLQKIEESKTDAGKHYIAATVRSADGDVEEEIRLWLTSTISANITFNTLRDIAVHNAKTEADKEKRRKAIDATADSGELVALMQKIVGAHAWATKYYDKERTYTDNEGKTRRSINTNLLGYQPKLKPELMPVEDMPSAITDVMGEELTKEDLSGIPF